MIQEKVIYQLEIGTIFKWLMILYFLLLPFTFAYDLVYYVTGFRYS